MNQIHLQCERNLRGFGLLNRQKRVPDYGLTFAVASMFSGSTKVRSRPMSCTAPPSSGSVSQIMCSMIRLIRRMSCGAAKRDSVVKASRTPARWAPPATSLGNTHVVVLLGLLHDKFSYHGGVVLHQIGEDVCGRPPHLNVIHSLCHQHTYWLLTCILSHR